MKPTPFRIQVPDATLEDLKARLELTRWPDEVAGAGWDYGSSLPYMKELVEHWLHRYDWRKHEALLNAWPHHRATISGLRVHFVHARGQGPAPLPIIITHGWPGSFAELLKLVPLLAEPARHGGDPEDAFDVVVPSMPGYGFSDRPDRPGMSTFAIADLWAGLMAGLGYERYGAQGGDWGASVSTRLAIAHRERIAGLHLNYIPGTYAPYLGPGARALSEAEQEFLLQRDAWAETEGGYGHLQRTRPQTLSYGLNDSPAGLAAWIVEKLRGWADCDGDVEKRFTKDEIITQVMIPWVTQTIGSSVRLYHEARATPLRFERGEVVPVPCAVAVFPKEAPAPPRAWVERGYDVRRWTLMPRGGHFAAMEEPGLLAKDIREFFRDLRA